VQRFWAALEKEDFEAAIEELHEEFQETCEVQELRNGKIRRITAFLGAPFDLAEWRKPFVEQT
jgi:hypothetical protein